MESMRCSNQNCVKASEHRGGRFKLVGTKWYCADCAEWAGGAVMNAGKELYSFTTTALTGRPIEVKGKAHLRQLERQYGVSHQQLNNMEKNW
jgi:hypothetical protein